MEYVTETMLTALLQQAAVLRLAIHLQEENNKPIWKVDVKFQLPKKQDAIERIFSTREHQYRVQPARLLARLEKLAEQGQSLVWARLVTHSQAASGQCGTGRSVVDLDRFFKRLAVLGAVNLTIDVYLGEHYEGV